MEPENIFDKKDNNKYIQKIIQNFLLNEKRKVDYINGFNDNTRYQNKGFKTEIDYRFKKCQEHSRKHHMILDAKNNREWFNTINLNYQIKLFIVTDYTDRVFKIYRKYNEFFKNQDTNNYFKVNYHNDINPEKSKEYIIKFTYYIFKKFIILVTLSNNLHEQITLTMHNLSNEFLFLIKHDSINKKKLQTLLSLYNQIQYHEEDRKIIMTGKINEIEKEFLKRQVKININHNKSPHAKINFNP